MQNIVLKINIWQKTNVTYRSAIRCLYDKAILHPESLGMQKQEDETVTGHKKEWVRAATHTVNANLTSSFSEKLSA